MVRYAWPWTTKAEQVTRLGCEPAPRVPGFVIGSVMEEDFRRAMPISSGDVAVFVERPVSLALPAATAALPLIIVGLGTRAPSR